MLNSDNIAITAQSFDYGPWRFTPFWDGHFTAAYFDHQGLYSFGRQPEAIHWDLVQLALSLRAIAEADALTPRLETFPGLFQEALRDAIFARLGLRPGALAEDMTPRRRDRGGARARRPPPSTASSSTGAAAAGRRAMKASTTSPRWSRAASPIPGALDHPYWSDPEPCSMHIEEVEAIWAAIDERDDWSPLHAKIAAMRRMGEALAHANA